MSAFVPSTVLAHTSASSATTSASPRVAHQAHTHVTPFLHPSSARLVPRPAHARPTPAGLSSPVAVVWFRDDLRLHDHPALCSALADNHRIAALLLRPPNPTSFWLAAAHDLRTQLRSLGADLHIRVLSDCTTKTIADVVMTFCTEAGATRLHFHRAVDANDVVAEQNVMQRARAVDIGVQCLWTGTLRAPEQLPFNVQDVPDDCDEFGRAVAMVSVGRPLDTPSSVPGVSGLPVGEIGDMRKDECGGERMGLKRVSDYCAGRSLVAMEKNVDEAHGEQRMRGSVSTIDTKFGRLGPFLALGCISPRRLWHEVVAKVSERSVRRFCAEFELVLRDFVRMMTLKSGMLPV